MIIWGSRGITSTVENIHFHCPQCGDQRNGLLKQVRNFFTLYFIPLIPLNVAGRYVECDSCSGSYGEEIVNYNPETERKANEERMLRVMVMAALADASVDAEERAEIERQYQQLTGLPIVKETLDNEIQMAFSAGTNLNDYVGSFANELSGHGKALVVQLAFHTMSASGDLRPGHQEQLMQLATTLGIEQNQFMALIDGISQGE